MSFHQIQSFKTSRVTVNCSKLSRDNLSTPRRFSGIARRKTSRDPDADAPNRCETFLVVRPDNLKSKKFEAKVRKAIEERKIFSIVVSGSQFNFLRFVMKSRGWIEKLVPGKRLKRADVESMMVQDQPCHFVWLPRRYVDSDLNIHPSALRNRISRHSHDFTRKDGLKHCRDDSHWHFEEGTSELSTPRAFTMHEPTSRVEFDAEFEFTSATSLLSLLSSIHDFSSMFSERGTVSSAVIEFALQHVEMVLHIRRHEDIDTINNSLFDKRPRDSDSKRFEWFERQFDDIAKHRLKFKWSTEVPIERLKMRIHKTVAEVRRVWPERIYDGCRNVWVVKPYEGSCGRGVCLMDNRRQILDYVQHHECNFIVQKYIGNQHCPC